MEWRLCVVLLCVTTVLAYKKWMEVTTAQGTVRGRMHSSGNLYAFYNIPYATAPVGVDKFKAPLPPPIWLKPYEAINENVVCPQNKRIIKLLSEKLVMREDCLVANVFVPDTSKENLSVLVYVHGGGFVMGYGKINKGTQLMKTKDFIMVTFNYRLGVHGFLCLGTEDIPGNAGMKDQVALLRWVQKNIASFGGNPHDVTLAGHSAGSASVDLIMLSKLAVGLFHRVIPESGGSLAAFAVQRDPLEIAKTYARKLNFTNVDDINTLEQFYKTTPMKLLTAHPFLNRTDSTFMFSPCVERGTRDGAFLTESPLSILKKGNYEKLPVLYGFANMEGLLRIDFFDIWKHRMNEKFSDFLPADLKFESDEKREEVANEVKIFYFGKNTIGNDSVLSYIDFFSDVIFAYPMLRAVKLHADAGNNQVYLYEYTFIDKDLPMVPYTNISGADHCAQSMAWLDNVDDKNESLASTETQNMRKIVREIWHNFIKTGKPVPEGSSLPAWPAAGANRSPHMSLGEKLELRGLLLEPSTRFWDKIYQRYFQDSVPPETPVTGVATLQREIYDTADNNISCHYVNEGDALPSAEDRNFSPNPDSIFFHETSCRGGLNSRQACAIESASRAHPRRQVYVLFSSPISDAVYQRSCIAKLRQFRNIRFARVHITDYAKKTPLEAMVESEPFKESKWRVEHTSDVLRYLTLSKWGGVYLDTDMMVVKSLTPLGHNWVARESNDLVNTAAIALSMDHLGRTLADAIINEIKTTYKPHSWTHNGPGVITKVLQKMCNTSNLADWSANTCQGLEVYGPEYFYPIHYFKKDEYFKAGDLQNVENAYTHHFWNKLTRDMKIEKDSPYAKMAQKFCPTMYDMYVEEFGS